MKTPNVASLAAIATDGRPVRFTVGTDVIDHYESSQTFGRQDLADPDAHGRFQRRMIAIPDLKQPVVTPMILTISSNHELSLVRQTEAVSSGWQRIDLSPGFSRFVGNDPQVQAIGAGWTEDDLITLAVAIDDGSGQSRSRLLVAYNLSSRETDWEHIAWIDCGTREHIRIEGIRVLAEGTTPSDRIWTIVVAGDRGPNDMLYLLRSTNKQTFATAFVFNPVVTFQTLFDFEVGVHPIYGGGIHQLGISGGARVLAFRPFPEYDAKGKPLTNPPVVVLPCPAGATVLESAMTREDGSDLYIAGQGIQLITAIELDNAEKAEVVQVVSAEAAPNVEDIVVGDRANGRAVVWALLQTGDLNVVQRNAENAWQSPLTLRRNVQAIAPVAGDRFTHTSVLVIYNDFRAGFVLQDAPSGVWQEAPLLVDNPSEMTRVTCYGTMIRVLDESGVPRPNVRVNVSASVLSSVRLNKAAVFIGPAIVATTETDENGCVSLLDRVQSLTPAVYRCAIEGVEGAFDINPAASMHQRFESLTTDELLHASIRTPSGNQPLLPAELLTAANRPQIEAMTTVLREAASLTRSTTGVVQGVRQVKVKDVYSSALRPETMPDGYRWGIQVNASGVHLADDSVFNRLLNASNSASRFFTNLGNNIMDFFEGLPSRIASGLAVVVQKAKEKFEVICEIYGKVKRFVLTKLEEAGSLFKWLWEQIKVAAEKVWEFVKFAFDWDDILLVREAMVNCTDDVFDNIMDSVDDLKKPVKDGFDQALKQIRSWHDAAPISDKKRKPSSVGKKLISALGDIPSPHQKIMEQVTGSAAFTWVSDKLKDLMAELIQFEGANPLDTAGDAITAFTENLLSDQVSNLLNCWDQIQTNLMDIFDHQMPSLSDFSVDTLKELVVMVGATALEGMLTGLRDLILRSLDLLRDFIRVVRDVMFLKVRFPALEKLIKLIAPGSNINTSFSLIDGIMLLASIPATVTYKIMFGEAPLQPGEAIVLPMRGLVAQDSSDLKRRASLIAGLVTAYCAPIYTNYCTIKAALELGKTGSAIPSYGPFGQLFNIGIAGLGFFQELSGSLGSSKGHAIDSTELAVVSVAGLHLMNQVVLVVPKGLNKAGKTTTETMAKFDKVCAVIEACCYTSQLILKTIIFGFITDQTRRSETPQYHLLNSFTWTKQVFDRSGLALISSSRLIKDPKTKLIVLGIGSEGRRLAFLLDFVRAMSAGELKVTLEG